MKMFEAILRLSKLDFKKESLCFICSIIIISISPSSGNVGEKKKRPCVFVSMCVKERKKEEKNLAEGGFTGKKVTKFVFLHRYIS